MTEDITSSPQQLRSMSQSVASPGPLHVSDLAPASNPPSRPRKLEPLQQRGSERVEGERDKKTRRKKTRRRAVEVGEVRGDLEGQEDGGRSGSIREERGPLHDVSLLKDMRARLDPLYNGSPSASLDGSYHDAGGGGEREEMQSKGHTETATSEQETEEQRETQQRKKKRRRRRRGSDRESGSGVSDTAIQQQDTAVDKQQTVEPEVMSSVADPSLQDSRQLASTVPEYFPPAEEIQDRGEPERMVVGASPSSPPALVHHHTSQPPDLVYVERPDGRGFDVHHKTNSVVPVDDTACGGTMKAHVSSELTALYSHRFVQRISLVAHGLVAGLSLWDCIVCNVLGSLPGRHLTLLQSYHPLSLPAHSLYILLLSLVSLSLLDRLDLAKLGKQCWQFTLRSLPGCTVLAATVLTGLAFIVSLSIAATDERISLYPDTPSLWSDIVIPLNVTSSNSTTPPLPTTHTPSQDIVYVPADSDPTTHRLRLWLGLAVFRSICCVLGWGLLVLVRDHDRMEEYIEKMMENSSSQCQLPSGSPAPTTADHAHTNPDQISATLRNNAATHTTSTAHQPPTHPA